MMEIFSRFDFETKKEFNNTIIEYGIINGDNTIVLIKSCQNCSLYVYIN